MSNYLKLMSAVTGLLVFHSCSTGNSPEDVAGKFLQAVYEQDYESAREYSTPETSRLIDLMETLSKVAEKSEIIKKGGFTILETKTKGSNATVSFREDGSEEVQQLQLKRVDGRWLVHITKEDISAKNITSNATVDDVEAESETERRSE